MIPKFNVTPPQSSTAATLHPVSITIEAELNYPAQLTAVFIDDWENNSTESTTARLQLNAYIDYTENSTHIFRGKIFSIAREVISNVPSIVVVAFDKLHILNTALAVDDSGATPQYIWSRYTSSQAITQIEMYKLPYYEGGYRERWAPAYTSEAWLSTTAVAALGINFTSTRNITNGDTEIRGTTANLGFPPSGLIRITDSGVTSVVSYNGYAYKASDGYWWFNGCKWDGSPTATQTTGAAGGSGSAATGDGLIGSDAADHLAANNPAVHLMVPKRIHFNTRILWEGYTGAAWEGIEDKHYTPNPEDGTYVFLQSPLTLMLNAGPYTKMRASYAVYDEEGEEAGAELITLSSLVADICTVSYANYGPSISASISSALANIIITRVVVDKPTYCMQFIRGLLEDLGLLRGTAYDSIGYFYNSSADAAWFKALSQSATPDRYYHSETRRNVSTDMTEVRAAVGATYTMGEAVNLCATPRFYHASGTATDGGVSGAGASPGVYLKAGNAWWESITLRPFAYNATQAPPNITGASGSAAQVLNLLTDGDPGTGVGLLWDSAANCEANDQFWAWFPGADDHTPDTYYITKVRIVLELIGTSKDATDGFSATLKHYDDLTPDTTNPYTTAPTSAHGAKYLDARLTKTFKTGSYNYDEVVLEADNLYVRGNAIVLEVESCMKATAQGEMPAGAFGYLIKEIRVEGLQQHFASCKLKGTYASSDAGTVTAAESYAKLVDSTVGDYPIQLIDLGPATREVALNFCWLQLLQLLALAQVKEYDISSAGVESAGVPILMETLQMSDGGIGMVDSFTYTLAGGERSLNVRITEYNTPLFGASL